MNCKRIALTLSLLTSLAGIASAQDGPMCGTAFPGSFVFNILHHNPGPNWQDVLRYTTLNGNVWIGPGILVPGGALPPAGLASTLACSISPLAAPGGLGEFFYIDPVGNIDSNVGIKINAGSAPALAGSGLVAYFDPILNTDNLFYQGADHLVHVFSRTTAPVGPWLEDRRILNVGAPAAAPASALTGHMTAASEELFYLGADNHVHECWRWSKNFDGWHATDVTLANGAKLPALPGSALASFHDGNPAAKTDAVFYIGANGDLLELLFTPNAIWQQVVMTPVGPPPAPGSKLAAHINPIGDEEVFYVTAAGLPESAIAFPAPLPVWNFHNMFLGALGGPLVPPQPNSPLAASDDLVVPGGRDELYYVGLDGNLHELFSAAGVPPWTFATP